VRPAQLNVRLSEAEAAGLASAAAECGLEVSAWARLVLVHASGATALAARLKRAERLAGTVRKAKRAR